jgi:diacylglycerol kinase (ATP)
LMPNGGAAFGPSLAFIPAGTGGDLRRNFGLSNDLEDAVLQLVAGERKPMDVGVLTSDGTADASGARTTRAFFNVASVGISGLVCDLANDGSKLLGGRLTFFNTSLRATFKYRNVALRIAVDGQLVHEGPTYVAAIANGRWFGGGMQIAPDALTDDGLLDVVILGDYSTLGAIGLARSIYAGTHVSRSKTKVVRGRVVELFAAAPMPSHALVETDGEVPSVQLPLRVEIIPAAITVCMPPRG